MTRDVLAARGLVASGLAVTLMPELLASGLPGIAMVPLEGPQPSRSLYALMPAAGTRPAALAFLEALAAAVVASVRHGRAVDLPAHPAAPGRHPRAAVPALGLPLTRLG